MPARGWCWRRTGRPIVWTETERKKGQAWGLKTIESFHTHGTPPIEQTRVRARSISPGWLDVVVEIINRTENTQGGT